jgi:hypothetical protein
MEIQSLKLFVTDADLTALLARHAPKNDAIEDVRVSITPEGVLLSGKYPTPFLAVTFETAWELIPAGPEVRVRLANVRVLGLPGGVLAGALMKMIRDSLDGQPGVRVEDDSVVVHAGEAARAQGVALDVKFTQVRLSIGAAVIEAG